MSFAKQVEPLLVARKGAKTKFMGVMCLAQMNQLRFQVLDFSIEGHPPEYGFAMTWHRDERDVWGKHVGETVSIPSQLIDDAKASAKQDGLDDEQTQVRVVAFVLAQGGLAQRLREKCGRVPTEVSKILVPRLKALREVGELEQAIARTRVLAARSTLRM